MVHLTNYCDTTCAPPDITDFAYYLNRVTDGVNQLSSYIQNTEVSYEELVSGYLDSLTAIKPPYMLVQATSQANKVYQYINTTCGIYVPSSSISSINLGVSYTSSYSVVPGTFYIIENNIKTTLPNPSPINLTSTGTIVTNPNDALGTIVLGDGIRAGITPFRAANLINNKSLACSSVTYVGIVFQAPISLVNIGDQSNDINFILYTSGGAMLSSYSVPSNPQTLNYTIATAISSTSTNKYINLNIDLTDPVQPTSVPTTITLSLPGYIVANSGSLISNNVTTNVPINSFNNITLDYSVTNSYQLVLSCDSGVTGSQSIYITVQTNATSVTKKINITL